MGTRQAVEIGLLDAAFGDTLEGFHARSAAWPSAWRATPTSTTGSRASGAGAPATRQVKPLNAYRKEELARSYGCFFGEDRSYHEARRRFVYKLGAPCAVTPTVARADALRAAGRAA